MTCLLKAGCQELAHHTVLEKAEDTVKSSLCECHGQQKRLRELQEPVSSLSRARATLYPLSNQRCRHHPQQEPLLLHTHPSHVAGPWPSLVLSSSGLRHAAPWASGGSTSPASQHQPKRCGAGGCSHLSSCQMPRSLHISEALHCNSGV